MSSPRELVETALHVLVAWNDGRKPNPSDVEILKQAFPSSAHLDVDDLCCQIIHDLCGRTFREADRERKTGHRKMDDVA